jgi:hypothetical protein
LRPRPAHRRKSKPARTGRHRASASTARKRVKLLGVAIPAVALAGALTAQFYPYDAGASAGTAVGFAARDTLSADATTDSLRITESSGLTESASAAAVHRFRARDTSRHRGPVTAARQPSRSSQVTGRHEKSASARPHLSAATKPPVTACSGTGAADPAFLPANYVTIVNFLTSHGYTDLAAAGIAGNIYQESDGDPESVGTGGGGLIGWTPLPAGYVTGDPAADLQTQLTALLTYDEQWAQFIPTLNAATTPAQAADIFMDYFERPGVPAAYNRESAAQAVAQACGFG